MPPVTVICAAGWPRASRSRPPAPSIPKPLASVHMWRIAADNDIAAAYAYGVDTNVPNPGRDEAVVTDAAILAAVDAIVDPE